MKTETAKKFSRMAKSNDLGKFKTLQKQVNKEREKLIKNVRHLDTLIKEMK